MRIKTLHGETDVPDWLKSVVRQKNKRIWIPFPALKTNLIGNAEDFFRIIREIVGLKLVGRVAPVERIEIEHGSFRDSLRGLTKRNRLARLMVRDPSGRFKKRKKMRLQGK